MLISLTTLFASLSSIFHSRAALQLENLALRHQIGVLHRSSRKRPKLTLVDRLLWVRLSRTWSGWRPALAVVEPETVVAWHRKGFPIFWVWKVRHGQPGRPSISRRRLPTCLQGTRHPGGQIAKQLVQDSAVRTRENRGSISEGRTFAASGPQYCNPRRRPSCRDRPLRTRCLDVNHDRACGAH
jgi:hypothetical protein